MSYTIQEHRHRFAVWTAGRAVARNFTTTEQVALAIKAANLHRDVEANTEFEDQKAFDHWHRKACRVILNYWETHGAEYVKAPSYGRAAKVVAIYLKTVVGMLEEGTHFMQPFLHLPIDRVLLLNMRE